MKPLENFINDARKHREQIKLEIGMLFQFAFLLINLEESLKNDLKKCVIIVDFTKFGIVDEGNVHCFIITLISGHKKPIEKGI